MQLTIQQLKSIMPHAGGRADIYLPYINLYTEEGQINTRLRLCHFLAQIAHESGELRYTKELASGKAYEGRADLGNTVEGDGVKYKGRGLIQITGRDNYIRASLASGQDFATHPELLERPQWATWSAVWFWTRKNLNRMADRDELTNITRCINGGLNGYEDRLKYLARAKAVIK